MKKIFLLLLGIYFLIQCSQTKTSQPPIEEPKTSSVSLIAFGDNLIHSSLYKAAQTGDTYDFSPMLLEISPFLENFNLRFINQETILGGKELGLSTYPAFNSPQELGDDLIDAGFNLISLANNHTLDRGEKAIINSVNFWESKGVIYSGSALSPTQSQVKRFTKNGISFAFVAYTYGTNGIPHPDGKTYLANLYSDAKAEADLGGLDHEVDVIIVSMHWGEEYQNFPNETQIEQARYLSSLGADIIIGHHPHVIQPVDLLENEQGEKTLVIYSLGNFLSDQTGIDRLIGMGVYLDIIKDTDGKIHLDNIGAKLLYRYKNPNDNSFRVLLFQDLNEYFLKDYQRYFSEKKELIQFYYPDIFVS